MILQYGNFAYFFYPLLSAVFVAGAYFLLRRRPLAVRKGVVLALMLINLLQHFFKPFLYPQYRGQEFNVLLVTAYNLCAFLIIASPVVLLFKSAAWKDFIALFGTFAGIVSMAIPHWFIGKPFWTWDVFRYYFCHALLFASSLLTLLLGLHRLRWRNFWKMPFLFFLTLILVCFDFVAVAYFRGTQDSLAAMLDAYNPCWFFHPVEQFDFIVPVIDFFTPDLFMGDPATGKPYTPLLWYFIPMYLLIALLSFAAMALADRRRFSEDCRTLGAKCRLLKERLHKRK